MFKDFGTNIWGRNICQEIRERDKIVHLNNNYQLIYGMELRSYAEKINVEVKTFLKVISANGIQPRIQFSLDVGKEESYYINYIIRRMRKYPSVISINFNMPDNMDYVKDLKLSAGSFGCDVQLTDIGTMRNICR